MIMSKKTLGVNESTRKQNGMLSQSTECANSNFYLYFFKRFGMHDATSQVTMHIHKIDVTVHEINQATTLCACICTLC